MFDTMRLIRWLGWLMPVFVFQPVANGSDSHFGVQRDVTIEDFQPHLMDEEGYYEEWSFGVWMKDGSFISVNFYISNLGIGDHKGAIKFEYKHVDGERTKCKIKYDDDEWSYNPNRFALQFGKNKLSGDLKSLSLTAKCNKLKIKLRFENQTDPFIPGSGKLSFGRDGVFYTKVFLVSRAKVTGEVELKNTKIPIKGIGQADHSSSSSFPHKYVRAWFRTQSISDEISINIAEMQSTNKYANIRNGWVLISDSEGSIVATAKAKFQYDAYIEDSRSDPNYRIPRLVKFSAVDGNTVITGRYIMQSLVNVRDPLDDLDSISRMIVRRFTKPRDYRLSCRYKISIQNPSQQKDRIIEGEGTYRMVFANP